MSDRHGYGEGFMFLAFVAGAATGAAVALLTAPKSGKETRDQLGEYVHTGTERTKHLPSAMKAATGAAKSAFNEAMHSEQARS